MTAPDILAAVSEVWGVPVAVIQGSRRMKTVVAARHAAFWIARMVAGWSYPQIGAAFETHHTTAINGVERAQHAMMWDALFSRRVGRVLELLGEGGRHHRSPCRAFVGCVTNNRPADFLPEWRERDDVCLAPGCGFRRGAHRGAASKAA